MSSGKDIELGASSGEETKTNVLKPEHPSIAVTDTDTNTDAGPDEIFEEKNGGASPKDKSPFEQKKSEKRSFKRFFSSRSKKSPAPVRLNGECEHNLAEYLLTPTHPKHLGIFQFMPFEHQELDDSISVTGDEKKEHAPLTKKEKLRHILHSKALHIIIIILVLIDAILVIFELLFDLDVFGEEAREHVLREVFHGFSIGILSMFMIELILKLWADHNHFIRHKIEVLDAVVVVVSWVLDIIIVFIDVEGLLAFELLLLLRLWRVFRIVNGIIVAVKTKADERVHLFKVKNKELKTKLNETEEKVKVLKNDIRILKAKLAEHGIKIEDTMI